MKAAGIPDSWSESSFKTPRARYKTRIDHRAGYLDDITRTFRTIDGFELAKMSYERLTKTYTEYRAKAGEEQKQRERAAEAEKERRKADIELVKLIVRYEAPEGSEWGDVLEVIRRRDQYLDLAIAGRETRGDWSEGFYRVENALGRFRIRDDRDKDIAADIAGCLGSVERDGRVFRDIGWSYDALFKIVSDQQLVTDALLCLEHIQ